MGTYCVSCKKNTANKNSSVRKTKHRKRIQKFRETSHLKHFYRNELYKKAIYIYKKTK